MPAKHFTPVLPGLNDRLGVRILWSMFSFLLPAILPAQVDEDSLEINTDHSYLRILSENDIYKLRGLTDRYYSNGFHIEYQFPQRMVQGKKMQRWFPTLPRKAWQKNKISAIFGMKMYTPENIRLVEVDSTDRPYAGWLYFGLGGTSNRFSTGERLTTQFTIGVLGPAAGQKKIQTELHTLLDNTIPQGWDNQIANDLALNFYYLYEKRVFYPTSRLETLALMEVNAGTVSNYIGVGGQMRVGRFNDYFYNSSGLKMKNKTYSVEELKGIPYAENLNRNFQIYFFARASFRFALDNSTLEGGLFSFRRSPYVLTSDEVQRFYLNAQFGLSLVFRKIGISFSQFYRSREFVKGNPTHWGAIRFVFGFNERE